MDYRHWFLCALVFGVQLSPLASMAAPHAAWRNTLVPKGMPGPELHLASGGQAFYSLLIPAQPTTQEEKAAADLTQWLHEMTDAVFITVREGQMAPPARVISLGNTALLHAANFPEAMVDLGDEGMAIAVKGKTLFLWGGKKRGPIYAVYALLEEDLGCRWYARGTSTIPHTRELTFHPVPRHFTPALSIRDPFFWDAFEGEWSLRNRTNAPNARVPQEWGGNVRYAYFVHSANTLMPPEKYFKEHPDYFAFIKGERSSRQPCWSNPETRRVLTSAVLETLKRDPSVDIISVSQNDDAAYCDCPLCHTINEREGTPAAALLQCVNAVADVVAKEYPGVKVDTLAYQNTFMAPKTIYPHHNVVIHLCTDVHCWGGGQFLTVEETDKFQTAMKAWAALGANINIWDYLVNFSEYLDPMPNLEVTTANIRFYLAHNASGVMLQSAYQSPGGADAVLKSWVWAKLLWDPSRDTRALMRDFVYGYYGAAANPMWQYQDLLWQLGRQYHRDKTIWYTYDDRFMHRANTLFDTAERLATDAETRRRVELARLSLRYIELNQAYVRLAQSGKLDPKVNAAIASFITVAKREKVTNLAEWRTGIESFTDGITALAQSAGTQSIRWTAKLPQGEVDVLRLPAGWKFAADHNDVGVKRAWFAQKYDDHKWVGDRSDLGCGWEKQGFPNLLAYGWYRTQLNVPADMAKPYRYLYFAAADEDAWVYLDGKLALDHSCAVTKLTPEQIWNVPFAVTDPRLLSPGQHSLAVRIYNRAGMGGLWKPVYLLASDRELDLVAFQQAADQQPK